MPNDYYDRLSEMNPGELADGLAMEQEFDAISRGFEKLPKPHRDGRGFEGPTRVGDPEESSDAVNLATLEKLNLPIYRKKVTSEDWNTITDAGIYDVVAAAGSNKAPGYNYGILKVFKFNGVVTQEYTPDKNGVLIKRTCENILLSVWGEWDAVYSASMGSPSLRNKITNGDFRINQRIYVSGSPTAAGQYVLDRWKVTAVGGITFSSANGKVTVTVPAGQTIIQVIEAINAQAGDYILSWGGSASGRVNGGAYGASGGVKVTIQGGSNITIEFSSGTVEYVQFELGSVPTPFEHRPYSLELGLCQRYFYNYSDQSQNDIKYTFHKMLGWNSNLFMFPSKMRATPTIGLVYPTQLGDWSGIAVSATKDGFGFTSSNGNQAVIETYFTANAEL
ncbi:hypothetical protein OB959_01375 [Aeromonas bestiarum]|uniref:Uncharacterized protein n=1 Tax=Aeromonas bestiarum TaxID=105751 RepID=A0AAW7HR62_9GAMM|nr:hypothetical protein [Aeromonas bestiarum]MDM5138451.1 hypothetical protein [Aeromonas bestiarum]